MGRPLNKSQRRAFARVLYHAFNTLSFVSGMALSQKEWFLESLTDSEKEELDKLKRMTFKLAERWRLLAWKLDRDAGK